MADSSSSTSRPRVHLLLLIKPKEHFKQYVIDMLETLGREALAEPEADNYTWVAGPRKTTVNLQCTLTGEFTEHRPSKNFFTTLAYLNSGSLLEVPIKFFINPALDPE